VVNGGGPNGPKKPVGAKWCKLVSDFAGWLALAVLVGSSVIWALAGASESVTAIHQAIFVWISATQNGDLMMGI